MGIDKLAVMHEIEGKFFSDEGIQRFPFEDHQLLNYPFDNDVNIRVIRSALDAIAKERGEEIIQVVSETVNKFYDMFAARHVKEFLIHKQKEPFNLHDRLETSDNKGPFKSWDSEKENLWISYEAYQIFNWICESLSNQERFLYRANIVGTGRDKEIERLVKTGLTPELTYKYGIPQFARKYNNTIFLTPLEVKAGHVVYELRVKDQYIWRSRPDNFRRGEEITMGKLAYVPCMFGLEPADVQPQQMMKDGHDRGIYIINYRKPLSRKYWDMSLGFVWAATVGSRRILEEQIAIAEDRGDRYLQLSKTLEQKVGERTEQYKMEKDRAEDLVQQLQSALADLREAHQREGHLNQQLRIQEVLRTAEDVGAQILHDNKNCMQPITSLSHLIPYVIKSLESVFGESRLISADLVSILEQSGVDIDKGGKILTSLKDQQQLALLATQEIIRGYEFFRQVYNPKETGRKELNRDLEASLYLTIDRNDRAYIDTEIQIQTIDVPDKYDSLVLNRAVFMNLIKNAKEAILMRRSNDQDIKGKILIRTVKKDDITLVEFYDNGIGIPDGLEEKIFKKFTSKKGGSGLGLSGARFVLDEQKCGRVYASKSDLPDYVTRMVVELYNAN